MMMASSNPPKKTALSGKIRGLLFSIATAVFLTVFKLVVGFLTASMGVVASAVDSLMDVFVSTVNLISLREAEKPADAEHLYGHGKIESLAGLFQSLVIGASGFYLVIESAKRLIRGAELNHVPVAIFVMIVSMALTFLLVRKLKAIARETESIIMHTESLHFTTDLLTNGGVIGALILVNLTGAPVWDLVIAIIIAVYILSQSFRILKTSVNELLDRALPRAEQKEIERLIMTFNPKIVAFHNLRTRKIGPKKFIDFHVQIDGEDNFARAHQLAEELIANLQEHFPKADVTIHCDPEDDSDRPTHPKD